MKLRKGKFLNVKKKNNNSSWHKMGNVLTWCGCRELSSIGRASNLIPFLLTSDGNFAIDLMGTGLGPNIFNWYSCFSSWAWSKVHWNPWESLFSSVGFESWLFGSSLCDAGSAYCAAMSAALWLSWTPCWSLNPFLWASLMSDGPSFCGIPIFSLKSC